MNLGSESVSKIYLGSNEIQKIYLGDSLILDGSASYLLDTYTNSSLAYSLRQLSSSTTSVVRVRRDSDNTEQDFSADDITDGTLTTFVGSGDGFVTTMYDQSGNSNHGVQTNTSNQPKIVDSGSLILENGNPSILVNDSNSDGFTLTNSIQSSQIYSFVALNPLLDTQWSIFTGSRFSVSPVADSSASLAYYLHSINSTYVNNSLIQGKRRDFYNATNNIQVLLTIDFDTGTSNIEKIFNRYIFELGGHFQEIILFESDESTNKSNIEQDLNDYYSIY